MSGYIKYFNTVGKNISLKIEHDRVLVVVNGATPCIF